MSITLMNKIDGEDIWIGGLYALRKQMTKADSNASTFESLNSAAITHVVSVLDGSLDEDLFSSYKGHHVIPVDDVEEENLLERFPAANEFIKKALSEGGKVFVHCAMGKSRSATVLCAYLMWSRKITRDEALDIIRSARSFIEPNPGFMHQLALYEQMKCTTDIHEHPLYQRWVYEQDVALSTAAGRAPERVHFRDAEQKAVELAGLQEGDQQGQRKTVELRCKKCRRMLANSEFLAPHIPKHLQGVSEAHPPRHMSQCSHHFTEPLLWMKDELEQGKLEGKLECPKCKGKVGSYAWQGMKCSCGEWVVPGISLARARVDEVHLNTRL